LGAGRKWSEIAAWEHTFAARPTDRRPWALIACRTTRQIVSVELIGTHGDAIESFAVRRDVPIERMAFGVGQVGVGRRRFAVYRLLQPLDFAGGRIVARDVADAQRMISAMLMVHDDEGVNVLGIHQIAILARSEIEN